MYGARYPYSADDVIDTVRRYPRPSRHEQMAVVRNYIGLKSARGKTKAEIGYKLEYLERELPEIADIFLILRRENGLPVSRVLRIRDIDVNPPMRRTASATEHLRPPTRVTRVTSTPSRPRPSAPANSAPVPVPLGDDEEPPPPPYASADPEPEQTRILEQRLAAEAVATGRVEQDRPTSTPASPANPPTSPPPPQRQFSIDSAPSDAEEREVWEESQLDEAKRASRLAEQERKDLEEAMRLSLVDAQGNPEAPSGPSNQAGSSSLPPVPEQAFPSKMPVPDGSSHEQAPVNSGQQNTSEYMQDLSSLSLMDNDEVDNTASTPTIQPTPTGNRLQSNNPFLSPIERQQSATSQTSPFPPFNPQSSPSKPQASSPGTPQNQFSQRGSPLPPTSPLASPPPSQLQTGSPRERRSLPRPPKLQTEPQYDPPPGPPPPHLRIPTPPPQSPIPVTSPPISQQSAIQTGTFQAAGPPPLPARPITTTTTTTLSDGEDPLEMLKGFDTVFLVDDSASMAGERWEQAKTALSGVAEIAAQYDEDGVDIYYFNSKRVGQQLKNSMDVEDVFSGLIPRGPTPTAARMEVILREYVSKLERNTSSNDALESPIKPLNLIVITDGAFALPSLARSRQLAENPSLDRGTLLDSAPSDDLESVLITAAKRLDHGNFPLSQVGIQFLQIGNDAGAQEALQQLDDGLSKAHGVRDMVDTVPFTEETMTTSYVIEALLGGVNRRLDRRG